MENPNIIQKETIIDHLYNLLTDILSKFEWILVASCHFFFFPPWYKVFSSGKSLSNSILKPVP